jgi:hypothetical protein
MASIGRTYIKPAKRDNGYFVPCYAQTNALPGAEPVCPDDVEPMYRVFNTNPTKVAPTVDRVDAHSYLMPVSSFDHMVENMGGQGDMLKKHYFYDTHDKLDIDTGLAVYRGDAPNNKKACIRVEPCAGPVKDLGLCCTSLISPIHNQLTDLQDESRSNIIAFETDLYLSYKQPMVNVPIEKEPKLQLTEFKQHKNNTFLKWVLISLAIFIMLVLVVVAALLIAFII